MTDVNGAGRAPSPLRVAVVELELHAHGTGWDQPPTLYALVDTGELVAAEPGLADRLGLTADQLAAESLTPVEQEALGEGPLDEVLARIAWPEQVLGCAVVQEVFVLPPGAEESRPEEADPVGWAAAHEARWEVRMVVGVLRDGASACVLRLRQPENADPDSDEPDVVYGDDLVPNLIAALRTTLD